MGVGGQHHAPAALPPEKTRYPLYRRLGRPQGRSGRVRKISPPTGIRSPDRPARSESLYRLRYPGPNADVPGYKLQFYISLMGLNRQVNSEREFLLKFDAAVILLLQHSEMGQQSIA